MFSNKLAKRLASSSKNIKRTFATGKDLRFGVECRALILNGVEKLSRAVAATLGPKGRNVAIESPYGAPKITKDGVTVAKAIEFSNKFENMGAQLVRQVASKTNDVAGDGTTTSTVLTHAIYSEGCKAVAAGMNPMDIKRGIDAAVKRVVDNLQKMTKTISTKEEIAQVATISANGDTEIGNLIATAMEKVGNEGVITVAEGKTLQNEIEIVEGMRFDRGYISPYFVNNTKTQKVEFEKPFILIHDRKISSINAIVPALTIANREGRPLLIIAEDVDAEALTALVINKVRGTVQVCAVKAPGFGDNRKNNLTDLAILTGSQLITEDLGMKMEEIEAHMFGSAGKVIVTKDDTVILNGSGVKADIEARANELRDLISNPSLSEYEKDKIQERLAKLSGGVAILKIGGASEVEVNEIKDRVTDALNATRAAVEEGIVPGGGSALLYASRELDTLKLDNFDQQHGVKIIQNAVRVPLKTIVNNAGGEGAVVVETLLRGVDNNGVNTTMGFNAQSGQYVDMVKAGIIDPTKVVRTALVDAASIASLMTTTEVMIVDQPKPEAPAGAGMPPGMGGMGGGMDMF